jgi:hypothetical protein
MTQINKKGFSTMDFTLAVLIFSGVIALLVVALGSLASDYDNPNIVNEKFSNTFDKFDEANSRTGDMWTAMSEEGGLSLIGTVEVLFFSTFRVISLVLSSVGEAGAQLFGISSFFGIPSAVSGIFFVLIIAMLTVVIIFKILSFVKGGRDL